VADIACHIICLIFTVLFFSFLKVHGIYDVASSMWLALGGGLGAGPVRRRLASPAAAAAVASPCRGI
jgi:hypothetical protein